MRRFLSIGLMLALMTSVVGAMTPEESSKLQFQLMKEGKYAEIGGLYDSAALLEVKETFLVLFASFPDSVVDLIFAQSFGASVTKKSAEAMSGQEFFGEFMEVVMGTLERMGSVTFVSDDILGRVMEGDTLCHLVIRTKMKVGESDLEELEIASYRRVGNEWHAVLTAKFKSFFGKLAQQMQRGAMGGGR